MTTKNVQLRLMTEGENRKMYLFEQVQDYGWVADCWLMVRQLILLCYAF
ncbi:MAG: hypothetical protein R3A44_16800 [Caldilineaceae bacterium]